MPWTMGIRVYSLLWVMQDLHHQSYFYLEPYPLICQAGKNALSFLDSTVLLGCKHILLQLELALFNVAQSTCVIFSIDLGTQDNEGPCKLLFCAHIT